MAYQSLLAKLGAGGGGVGAPPAAPAAAAGGVPPAQPHIEPAPYDVATDPAWKGIVDPNDHELRNFLNQTTPEERQMLLMRLMKMGGAGAAPAAPAGAPGAMPGAAPGALASHSVSMPINVGSRPGM